MKATTKYIDITFFTSTDVQWENPPRGKYAGWSPYAYCRNNPVNLVDWNGKYFVYPKNKDEKEKYEQIIKKLEQTPTGKALVRKAKNAKQPVTLAFKNFPDESNSGDENFIKKGSIDISYIEAKKELVDATITLDPTASDIIPLLGHELTHFKQYLKNVMKWIKSEKKDKKNNTFHDDCEGEQMPIENQTFIREELKLVTEPETK